MLKIRCQTESGGVWRDIGLSDVVECAVADLLRLVAPSARALALARIFAPFAASPNSPTIDAERDLNAPSSQSSSCNNAMRIVARFAMYCAIHAAPSPTTSTPSMPSLASVERESLELLSQLFDAYVLALAAQQSINIRPSNTTTATTSAATKPSPTQQQQQQPQQLSSERNDAALIYMHAYRAAATVLTKASAGPNGVPASLERLLWRDALRAVRPIASLAASLLAFLSRNATAAFRHRQSLVILSLVSWHHRTTANFRCALTLLLVEKIRQRRTITEKIERCRWSVNRIVRVGRYGKVLSQLSR
jgi:hypothetical protein